MTRVYLPVTLAELRELAATGTLPVGLEGYAATAAIGEELRDCTDEEVEFALSTAAGDASAQYQLDAGRADGRRVVVVVEVDDRRVATRDDSAGLVAVAEPIDQESVEAILADPATVRLGGEGEPLAWYAVQELSGLLP